MSKEQESKPKPDQVWVNFFLEILRLSDLIDQRLAEQETRKQKERDAA